MSVRSAVGFPYTPNFPIGNQTLEETLANGNNANQLNIIGVKNLDVFTINGNTINQGLNSVLNVSNVAGGLDIQDVGTLTANKVVELGRESKFGYITNQVKIVGDATPFQIDISGGTLTLTQGSYLFNFKVNFSSATAVGNYTLQLFLDAVKITESLITPTGGLSGATLIINSIPVTITGVTGVVSLKGLVSTANFVDVTIQGFGSSYYSYLEIYKGVSPPPINPPFNVTSGNAPFEIQQISSGVYLYYMKLTGASVLTPNYQFTLNELFLVGDGDGGLTPVGGNGGGVLLYNTPVSVGPTNAFTLNVGKLTTAVVSSTAINLNSTSGTVALGGEANQVGGDGTQYLTTGLYYGGGGGGGGVGNTLNQASGKKGGLGGGGGSGSQAYTVSIIGGVGGGDGVNAGGAGDGESSRYGGGGGIGFVTQEGGNGGDRGGGGGRGGDRGSGSGGGGGGAGNYGGGGGGGGIEIGGIVEATGGGGGAGIIIIKITL